MTGFDDLQGLASKPYFKSLRLLSAEQINHHVNDAKKTPQEECLFYMVGMTGFEPATSSATPPSCGARYFYVLQKQNEISTAAPSRTPFIRPRRRSCSKPKAGACFSMNKSTVYKGLHRVGI